jgi:hypothetical protein
MPVVRTVVMTGAVWTPDLLTIVALCQASRIVLSVFLFVKLVGAAFDVWLCLTVSDILACCPFGWFGSVVPRCFAGLGWLVSSSRLDRTALIWSIPYFARILWSFLRLL